MKDLRLQLALVLSVLAWVATLVGGPAPLRVVAIGGFVIFAPGLVLTHVLRISDALLSLVIMMMTGPSLWVLVATLEAFTGLWAPTTTIVAAAVALAATCGALLIGSRLPRRPGRPVSHAHERSRDALDEPVVTAPPGYPGAAGYDE